jgi:hypothetical protein
MKAHLHDVEGKALVYPSPRPHEVIDGAVVEVQKAAQVRQHWRPLANCENVLPASSSKWAAL